MRTSLVYVLVLCAVLLRSQSAASFRQPLLPSRITQSPVIDGSLDDPVWRHAAKVDVFRTYTPDFGREVPQTTATFMAYDSDNLYFAFRCDDDRPDLIKATMTGRDNIRPDDWICINLDTFNDQQSLYAFYVNPVGIQMDSRYAANQEDFSVDLLWESAGSVDSAGYSVEIALPLKSLRFAGSDSVTMAVYFERRISRTSEQVAHPPMDPAKGFALVTQTAPLVYRHLHQAALVEFIPAFTFRQRSVNTGGGLRVEDRLRDFSLTGKYGLSTDLILDATYNPDFSQVEADAGQVDVNLRNALFFAEKRPFFLEGSEIYNVAATVTSEVDPVQTIVHTRTIVNPLVGVKVSGKIAARSTVAMLYGLDEMEQEAGSASYAHVPVLRLKQSLWSDSYAGAMYAGREEHNTFSRLFGVDGMLRLTEGSMIDYNGIRSIVRDTPGVSPTAGHTVGLRYTSGTRDLDLMLCAKEVSEQFRADIGYVTRTGLRTFSGLIRPRWYPPSSFVQRLDFELFSAQTEDLVSGLWETSNHLSVQAHYAGTLMARVRYRHATEIFAGRRFRTGGAEVLIGGDWSKAISLYVQYQRLQAIYYDALPFQGRSTALWAQMIAHPTENIETRLTAVFTDFSDDADGRTVYEYPIFRGRLTYQVNKHLFFRGVAEYNRFRRQLLTDFLASFTYVPGTVVYLGYGSVYEKREWVYDHFEDGRQFHEMRRGFFFKMSYLWRL